MRKVGIYGGSYNPIHNGHISLARQFLSALALDEVWFVVSPQNPFKAGEQLLDDELRLELVRRALQGEPRLKACDVEFHLPKPSYMWNTLCRMREACPDCDFVLLIGSDNWTCFDRWYHADDILRNFSVAVYPRRDDPIDVSSLPENVRLLDALLLDVSSTEIRRRVAAGEPVCHLVPAAILRQVEQLYGKDSTPS